MLNTGSATGAAGSAMGGMNSFATAVEALETAGHRKMNPFCIPNAITNMPVSQRPRCARLMGMTLPCTFLRRRLQTIVIM